MKAKLFFILCLCSLSMKAWGNPAITTGYGGGSVWSLYREYYSFVDKDWEHRTDLYFFEAKNTVIGSYSYCNVLWREEGDYTKQAPAGYALREDSDRVYVYDYGTGKEHVFFDFSLKENDILAVDWIEETETRKNPVFRVLAVGDTITGTLGLELHYLKVYDTVHQVTDMWLTRVGSVSHGIAWRRDFALDTIETVLCVRGKYIYGNQEYKTCFISKSEPEYVSCKEKLILVPEPFIYSARPDCPCTAMAIQWGELTPILVVNTRWARNGNPLEFQGVEYREGDSIEVEGYVSIRSDLDGLIYSVIELEGTPPVQDPVPVEKRQKSELKLSPNPAKETITLRATGCNLQKVETLDVNGRILHSAALNGTASFDYNVSQMPSGIYLARVKTSCGVLTEKFAVK